MCVFQQPGAVGLLLGPEQPDCFGQPGIGRITGGPEVVQGAEDVIVPAGGKGELLPGRVNDFAGALAPEESPFKQILLAPPPGLDGER